MSLNYAQYQSQMLALTQFNAGDPNFTTFLSSALDYAQDRINRELNFLDTVFSFNGFTTTPNIRLFNFNAANVNVLLDVNIITPAGEASPELGTRNPVTICSKEYLNAVYNSATPTGIPVNFALLTDYSLLFGPWPDQAYTVEVIGTQVPFSLASVQNGTWVSLNLPDLLIAASMIYMAGAMKNFGAQSDDPKMSESWESQYILLRDSAAVEDARRKFMSSGWQSDLPNQFNPPRT